MALLADGKAQLVPQAGRRRRRPAVADDVVEFPVDTDRPGLHGAVRVRRPGLGPLRHRSRPAAQPDPRARPRRRQLHVVGLRLQHRPLRRDVQRRRASRSRTTTSSSPRAATPRPTPSPTGSRCPATPRRTATTRSRTAAARGPSSATRPTPGTTPRSRPARPPAEIDAYLAQFDKSGPLRLRRATATSTSPTATSTTSRPIHAGEGEEAGGGAQGDGRHLVAPLVRLRHRLRRQAGPNVGGDAEPPRRHADRRLEVLRSATTPSSPRTAASASSPTSSATTSACRTTTTPTAARTAPASGR